MAILIKKNSNWLLVQRYWELLLVLVMRNLKVRYRGSLLGRLVNFAEYLQGIKADCVSISYGVFCTEDIEQIHAAGISVVLGDLWNPNVDIFQRYEIDIFSHGNPLDARKILNR